MDFKQIESFFIIAECGSFSKAAEKAFISKQALLKQIKTLENELGVSLFIRGRNGVTLTDKGSYFYEEAGKLMDIQRRIISKCHETPARTNTLRISQVEHQRLLTPVMEAYHKQYPEVEFIPVIHPDHSGERRVENGLADVAEALMTEDFPHKSLLYTHLLNSPYMCVMSDRHPLAEKQMLSLLDIADYNAVYFYQLINNTELLNKLQKTYNKRNIRGSLIRREDIDNQIEVTFEILAGEDILITANPYINYLEHAACVLLEGGYTQDYGIVTREDPSPEAEDFVKTAVDYYRHLI